MMNKKKPSLVGIIAENDSDVESVRVLIHRITNNDSIGFRKFLGKGCGNIIRKSNRWACNLKEKGCTLLILIHDLDNKKLEDLKKKIYEALNPCPLDNYLICIPIQAIEAWLLSDPAAIKTALNLKKLPKITGFPYNITKPKEYLSDIINTASDGEKFYLNTKHNEKIAKEISIDKVRERNPSFIDFHDFIVINFIK